MNATTRHRAIAVLALAGLFLSLSLLLYGLGFYGDLLCGVGSCEVVQTSEYAVFMGVPVSGWGTAWYAGIFALALWMASGRADEGSAARAGGPFGADTLAAAFRRAWEHLDRGDRFPPH